MAAHFERLGQATPFYGDQVTVQQVSIQIPNCSHVAAQLYTVVNNSDNLNLALAVHGWMDNSGSFVPLLKHLLPMLDSRVFKYVLAIDMPGCGQSTNKGTVSYPVIESVYDLLQVLNVSLNGLGISGGRLPSEVTYLGHSLGGGHGYILSSLFPDRIHRLITIDALGYFTDDEERLPDLLKEALQKREEFDEKMNILSHNTSIARRQLCDTKEELIQRLHKRYKHGLTIESARYLTERGSELVEIEGRKGWRLTYDPKHTAMSLFRMSDQALFQFLGRLTNVPILTLWPESSGWPFQDRIDTTKRRRFMQQVNPRYKEVFVAGTSGHHFHMDYPKETALTIASYLQEQTSLRSKL